MTELYGPFSSGAQFRHGGRKLHRTLQKEVGVSLRLFPFYAESSFCVIKVPRKLVSGRSGEGCRREYSKILKLLSFGPKIWTLGFLRDWEISGSCVLSSLPWEPCAAYLVLRRGNPAVVANQGRAFKTCLVPEMHLDLRGLTMGCHDFPGQVSSPCFHRLSSRFLVRLLALEIDTVFMGKTSFMLLSQF